MPQGIAEAKHSLGHRANERGNVGRALLHYREAADLWYGASLNCLSWMYSNERGVQHDLHRAIELARAAFFFDNRLAETAYSASEYYELFVDHPEHLKWSLRWLQLARQRGATFISRDRLEDLEQRVQYHLRN